MEILLLLLTAGSCLNRSPSIAAPGSLRGAPRPSYCLRSRAIRLTSKANRSDIQSATKRHPNLQPRGNEPATKAHPTAASVNDNGGRWATDTDNDDRAGGFGTGQRGARPMQGPLPTTRI